ncbi:uncharacterized protein BDR25DRAFT_279393 [Lindgomyces ingoldianus]|uniref:Uncharacterized protein n=1 Tax=Lindgomyces ingoldianus TaxID=673940 RepID=A0ACB6R847_9PLEO|nr:uncharacterized protein BDR25DRAFT_279393 [Lindgomyces ingoldianus]KAF2475351.1 hypothetical protein BDR25DRAFT_279393 [Lindgomyces ingoldianus]
MDRPGSSVPAWRRLGLKLRTTDQSGDAVPESNVPKSVGKQPEDSGGSSSGRNGVLSETHSGHGPTQNGKPSRLGKRKTQDRPAEGHGHAFKKSKKSEGHEQHNGGPARTVVTTSRKKHEDPNPRPNPALATEIQHPQGDPNYRKKKGQRISHKQPRQKSPSPREISPGDDVAVLRVSTENGFSASLPPEGIQALLTTPRALIKSHKLLGTSPPSSDRRKSVTFTPDTKTADGNSATTLFKKWVSEQGNASAEFSPAEVALFIPPPKAAEKETKNKRRKKTSSPKLIDSQGKVSHARQPAITPPIPSESASKGGKAGVESKSGSLTSRSKKKDPSVYLDYLLQYHNHRENWKFNKTRQNDVLDNALNIFRIREEHSAALLQYIEGLQGAGVISRLTEQCKMRLKELDEEDRKAMGTMDNAEDRKAAKYEALQARLAQEKKRRRTQEDIQGLAESENPDGYIRRLKRHRAEALLVTLSRTAPLHPIPATKASTLSQYLAPTDADSIITRRPSRKRKSRTEISSDDDSSTISSSSDEQSSSDNDESEDDDSNSSEPSDDARDSSDAEEDSDEESSSTSTASVKSTSNGNSEDDESDSRSSSSSSDSE